MVLSTLSPIYQHGFAAAAGNNDSARSMGTFGWGSPFLTLCEMSLLPAAVWAAH